MNAATRGLSVVFLTQSASDSACGIARGRSMITAACDPMIKDETILKDGALLL